MELHLQLSDANSRIIIERHAIHHCSDYFDLNRKVLIISDDGVPDSLKDCVMKQCEHAHLFVVHQGETAKSFEVYQSILQYLLAHDYSRNDCIIALGGGVIGDLSGFVAATFKRGMTYYSIPTTTLSQIDSSIGGKVAINMGNVKNVVGTFYHPQVVLIDMETLHTLPKRHFYNGLVEALKAGCIQDPVLFDLFENHISKCDVDSPILEEIITRSLIVKKKVVEEDEKEQNLRKILNFGHTLGHAIESYYHLSDFYHGECVANGMILIEENNEIRNRLIHILKQMNIPLNLSIDEEQCMELMKNDKKASQDSITIIQVPTIGTAEIKKVSIESLRKYLRGRV